MISRSVSVSLAYCTPSALLLAGAAQKILSFAALTLPFVMEVDLLLSLVLLHGSQLMIPTHYVEVFTFCLF